MTSSHLDLLEIHPMFGEVDRSADGGSIYDKEGKPMGYSGMNSSDRRKIFWRCTECNDRYLARVVKRLQKGSLPSGTSESTQASSSSSLHLTSDTAPASMGNSIIYCPTRDKIHYTRHAQEILEKLQKKGLFETIVLRKEYQDCRTLFDFFLPEHEILLHIDGPRHFQKVWGHGIGLKRRRERDLEMDQFCMRNEFSFLRLSYDVFNDPKEAEKLVTKFVKDAVEARVKRKSFLIKSKGAKGQYSAVKKGLNVKIQKNAPMNLEDMVVHKDKIAREV